MNKKVIIAGVILVVIIGTDHQPALTGNTFYVTD